jgi:hypothetical protein
MANGITFSRCRVRVAWLQMLWVSLGKTYFVYTPIVTTNQGQHSGWAEKYNPPVSLPAKLWFPLVRHAIFSRYLHDNSNTALRLLFSCAYHTTMW